MKRRLAALAAASVHAYSLAQDIACVERLTPPGASADPHKHHAAPAPALMSGAIRVGPPGDRIELAGGTVDKVKDGYDIVYRFPGNETKWLMCAYGKDGALQSFERMHERTTECRLQVRDEMKPGAKVRMACK